MLRLIGYYLVKSFKKLIQNRSMYIVSSNSLYVQFGIVSITLLSHGVKIIKSHKHTESVFKCYMKMLNLKPS